MNWSPLSDGWFIQWAVENESRRNPTKSIRVYDGATAICGYVPDNWDGDVMFFSTTKKSRVVHNPTECAPLAHDDGGLCVNP